MAIFISRPIESSFINDSRAEDEENCILSQYNLQCLSKLVIYDRLNSIPNYTQFFEYIKKIQCTDIGHVENAQSRFSLTALNKEKFILISFSKRGIPWSSFLYYLPLNLQTHYLLNAFENILSRFLSIEDNLICFYKFSESNITFNDSYSPTLGHFEDAFVVDKTEDTSYISKIITTEDGRDMPFELFMALQSHKLSCKVSIEKYVHQCNFTKTLQREQIDRLAQKLTRAYTALIPTDDNEKEYIINCFKGWKTWNLFFLSSFYIRIIHKFIQEHELVHPFWNEWVTLLERNMSPDISERCNIPEMLNHFHMLKMKVSQWKDVFSSHTSST